jgi:hypothetical protein
MPAMADKSSPSNLQIMWLKYYTERLKLLANDKKPTERQIQLSKIHADNQIEAQRKTQRFIDLP